MGDEIERKRLLIYERTKLGHKETRSLKLRYAERIPPRTAKRPDSPKGMAPESKARFILIGLTAIFLISWLILDSKVGSTSLALAIVSFFFVKLLDGLYYGPRLSPLGSHPIILSSGRLVKTGYLFMRPANSTTLAGNCRPGLSAAIINMRLNGGLIATRRQLIYFVRAKSLSSGDMIRKLRSRGAGLAKAYESAYNVRLVPVDAPANLNQMVSVRVSGFRKASNIVGQTVRASMLSGRYQVSLLPRMPLFNSIKLNDKGVLLVSFAPLGGVFGRVRTWLKRWLFAREMKKTSLYDEEPSEGSYFVALTRRVLSYNALFSLSMIVLTFGSSSVAHSENVESIETSMGTEMEQHSYEKEEEKAIRGFRIAAPRSVELKDVNPVSAIRKFFSFSGITVTPLDLEYIIYPLPNLKGYTVVPKPVMTSGDMLIGTSVEETLKDSYPYHMSSGDLNGNVLIIGTTGSGKSVTAATIVKNLKDNVLILDWNGEYSNALSPEGFETYAIGEFTYNPFERSGTSREEVPLRLTELMNGLMAYAYRQPLTPTQYRLLANALMDMESYSIRILVKKVCQKLEGEKRPDVLRAWESLYAKLAPFDKDYFITSGDAVHCDQLLCGRNIVDMRRMDENGKLLLALSMLENLYRIAVHGGLSERLVVVVDEAHRLQYSTSKVIGVEKPMVGVPPPIIERITRECRKHGLNMVLITQTPSGVTDEVQANLGVVICHRMKGMEAEVADSIIGLSKRFGEEATASLLTLPTGYAYIETARAQLQLVHVAANDRELVSRMEVRARNREEMALSR